MMPAERDSINRFIQKRTNSVIAILQERQVLHDWHLPFLF